MKRAIIPEQLLPSSLAHLQQQLVQIPGLNGAVQPPLVGSGGGSISVWAYSGRVSSVGTGDYVAVLVERLAGSSTLMSKPLAKTTIQEFVQVFGSSTPAQEQIPGWLLRGGPALCMPSAGQPGPLGCEREQDVELAAAEA